MRLVKITAIAFALSQIAVSGAFAAPSAPYTPVPAAEAVWCKKVCKVWGYCGHGHAKYKCCKHSVCH